ncbi:DUF167 domain-containing protein [Mesobacterium pallidum]|uniref:DUF167 domain-containing protein n=1 Tax=Mesobacterium pallidum TaxID=2872037 RepID=UPI001EE1E98D|nr:DUF167 domain-containing protein [Mesobacterium pallidum]
MDELRQMIAPGQAFEVRVTPKAARNRITVEDGQVRVYVTTAPEDGKANAAVAKLLATALGVGKTRLELVRGATSRDKTFRLLD